MAPKTSHKKVLAAERRRQAWEMKLAGVSSNREIARKLGVTPAAITKYLQRAIANTQQQADEDAKSWAAIELERLGKLLAAHWSAARGYRDKDGREHPPQRKAADLCLRIIRQRTDIMRLLSGQPDVEVKVASSSVQVYIPDNGRLPGNG
jgi:predicted transcriptional regulator